MAPFPSLSFRCRGRALVLYEQASVVMSIPYYISSVVAPFLGGAIDRLGAHNIQYQKPINDHTHHLVQPAATEQPEPLESIKTHHTTPAATA